MVININPNRVNVRSGSAGKSGTGQRQLTDGTANTNAYSVPKRSDINYIPTPESLGTLIRGAVSALRQGVYWDRGTILNLLV